jgi:hypothetical protein
MAPLESHFFQGIHNGWCTKGSGGAVMDGNGLARIEFKLRSDDVVAYRVSDCQHRWHSLHAPVRKASGAADRSLDQRIEQLLTCLHVVRSKYDNAFWAISDEGIGLIVDHWRNGMPV